MIHFQPGFSPEQCARNLSFELKILYPVNVIEVIEIVGLLYREKDMGKSGGYDGCLVQKRAIIVNSNIQHESRKKFTAAHELGHFLIKGHDEDLYNCFGKDIQRFYGTNQETEANKFAAEFLLPENRIKEVLRKKSVSMQLAKKLSNEYGTSLTSTLLRLVKLTEYDNCAVIVSDRGFIKWSAVSQLFRKNYVIGEGQICEDSYAHDLFIGRQISNEPKRVRPECWIGGNSYGLESILEESVPISNFGLVLTLITVPEEED